MLVCVFDCTKLLKDHFILADQIQLSEIFASYFNGLNPFAGNLCMQLAWRIIRQWWGCLTYSLPNLLLYTCYFLGYQCNYLEDHPYPFPKEQLCSFVRTVCHPKALGNLKNLSMVIFLLHSMPYLWIICWEIFIAPKASAEGACIFSKLGYYGACMMGYYGAYQWLL